MKPFGVLCGQNFRISMYARGSMDDMHKVAVAWTSGLGDIAMLQTPRRTGGAQDQMIGHNKHHSLK